VLRQLTPKSCYPLGESTSFPPNPLMPLSEIIEFPRVNLAPLRSLTSPDGLTDPMALRNPACPCGTRRRALAPWPGRRIAPLSPLKGVTPFKLLQMDKPAIITPRALREKKLLISNLLECCSSVTCNCA